MAMTQSVEEKVKSIERVAQLFRDAEKFLRFFGIMWLLVAVVFLLPLLKANAEIFSTLNDSLKNAANGVLFLSLSIAARRVSEAFKTLVGVIRELGETI